MLKLAQIVCFAGALAALSTAATAQPAARGMAACRVDVATFCQGIEAGRGNRVACLMQNKDKLSPDCQATIEQRASRSPRQAAVGAPAPGATPPVAAVPSATPATPATPPAATLPSGPVPKSAAAAPREKGAGRFAACRTDMQALCAAVAPGGGNRIRCLQDNQAKLSPACADSLTQLKGAKQDARQACATDANRLCPGLKGEERRACFAANQAQLSPDCAAAVGKRASVAPKQQ